MIELLARQHEVIAVVDDLNRHTPRPGLHFKIGALGDADQVEQGAAGGSAVIALLAPGDLATQARASGALLAGLARTTIRRLLLVGDFEVLDEPVKYSEAERVCVDQVVDGLQRSSLRWTLINMPAALSEEGLARIAAGMVDMLELDLHRGEHLNFVL
jgi:putative NADH-flavin reductase